MARTSVKLIRDSYYNMLRNVMIRSGVDEGHGKEMIKKVIIILNISNARNGPWDGLSVGTCFRNL